MSEAKFTPGPWELVSLSGYGSPFSIRMAYLSERADVPPTHYGVQSVRRREDACLIAAAPELFLIAKRIEAAMDFDASDHPMFDGMQDQLRAALAKATGGQQ